MLRVGIIGAGTISARHIEAFLEREDCVLTSIADINKEQLDKRANQYKIEKAYTDYHKILEDDEIDAVDIVTPTFTHKQIVIDALRCGKHVICEKPPALNAQEVLECKKAALESGKVLMFTFVCRFSNEVVYLKKYIDSGKMGAFVCGEAARLSRCSSPGGWMLDKSKVGGPLLDGGIHELDTVLYLMGYPRPKAVTGFTSYVNSDLPERINGVDGGYKTADKTITKRTIDSASSGYILLENGAYIFVKVSSVLNVVDNGSYVEVIGEKSGAKINKSAPVDKLKMLEITDDNYFAEVTPKLGSQKGVGVRGEIAHFVDCCVNGTECICKIDEAVTLLQIIDAIYKSAETGETIYFED